MFIELTSVSGDKHLVNTRNIIYVANDPVAGTHIYTVKLSWRVRESYEEVVKLILEGTTVPSGADDLI